MQVLKIADKSFESRLFTGTGKFSSSLLMRDALLASESQLVTVALKRVDINNEQDDILNHLNHSHINLLPNTSGARTAEEAIFAAELAREALETNWLKLEIHPDPKYLMPDPIETLKAAEKLSAKLSAKSTNLGSKKININTGANHDEKLTLDDQLQSIVSRGNGGNTQIKNHLG